MNNSTYSSPSEAASISVESVLPLSEPEITELTQIFQAKIGPVSIKNEINPLLLGGLKITYQGKVIDLSLNTKIQAIHKNLIAYAQK